jgi:hypothetical protein
MNRLIRVFDLYCYYRRRQFTVGNALSFAWRTSK